MSNFVNKLKLNNCKLVSNKIIIKISKGRLLIFLLKLNFRIVK